MIWYHIYKSSCRLLLRQIQQVWLNAIVLYVSIFCFFLLLLVVNLVQILHLYLNRVGWVAVFSRTLFHLQVPLTLVSWINICKDMFSCKHSTIDLKKNKVFIEDTISISLCRGPQVLKRKERNLGLMRGSQGLWNNGSQLPWVDLQTFVEKTTCKGESWFLEFFFSLTFYKNLKPLLHGDCVLYLQRKNWMSPLLTYSFS